MTSIIVIIVEVLWKRIILIGVRRAMPGNRHCFFVVSFKELNSYFLIFLSRRLSMDKYKINLFFNDDGKDLETKVNELLAKIVSENNNLYNCN